MLDIQTSFQAGFNLIIGDINIPNDGYKFLFNARQRFGYIQANKKNIKFDNAPVGNKQGCIGVGNFLIIFVEGKAYFKLEGTDNWIQIGNFQMDADVENFFSIVIPASTFNYVRKLNSSGSINDSIIQTNFRVSGTPSGILVQDGINQPWIIEFNEELEVFTARVTKNYSQWVNNPTGANDREYVPIGKQMMFINEILFIVAPDGKSVYRSVTGRPLDFMVNVDPNGNKLAAEGLGGASSVSFAFDFDTITAIKEVDVVDSFIYATDFTTRIITLDYTKTIFGEPTFRTAAIIKVGVKNQYSIIENNGDYVLIDSEGITTFNAVLQLRNEGRNSPFSVQLQTILRGKKQVNPNCAEFDNYLLFNLDTTIGDCLVIFDKLLQRWVAIDITLVTRVKQFATVDTTSASHIYCVTQDNEVFKLYASDENELGILFTRGLTPEMVSVEHKSTYLRPFFKDSATDGTVSIFEYVDGMYSQRLDVPIEIGVAGVGPAPVFPPVIPSTIRHVNNDQYLLKDGLVGKMISFVIQWNTDAKLYRLEFSSSERKGNVSIQQSQKVTQATYALNS